MKVIFLDIDGVLNSTRWLYTRQFPMDIDPAAVARLNYLVGVTDAKVVISSTWRRFVPLKGLVVMLNAFGFQHAYASIIDTTPEYVGPNTHRGDEIASWLANNPIVTSFVIVDDGNDMGRLTDRLVRCDLNDGLLDADVDMAIAMLNDGAPSGTNG